MTYEEFLKKFPSEKKVIDYFIKVKYPEEIKCSHCGSTKVYHRNNEYKVFDCSNCHNSFSIFKGTIFEKTSTDLTRWMYAIHLFLNAKKGISAKQLQREIGVTYKTAWRMLRQIRIAMGNGDNKYYYEAVLEIDETYIGGKPRKENNSNDDDDDDFKKRYDRRKHTGRGTKKTPVVGVVNRDDNHVFAKVVLPNKDGKKLTGIQLLRILIDISNNDKANVVLSDEFRSYDILKKTEYRHYKINHNEMFGFGGVGGFHTNTIESFWAIVKRSVYGIYHKVSVKYLQLYLNEFAFRRNNREIDNSFDLLLKNAIGV